MLGFLQFYLCHHLKDSLPPPESLPDHENQKPAPRPLCEKFTKGRCRFIFFLVCLLGDFFWYGVILYAVCMEFYNFRVEVNYRAGYFHPRRVDPTPTELHVSELRWADGGAIAQGLPRLYCAGNSVYCGKSF